jgi:Ankyrin repeats (3 copies)
MAKNETIQLLPTFNILVQPSILHSPAQMLQTVLGDERQSINPVSLASQFLSTDTNDHLMPLLNTSSRLVALQTFVQCFVVLTNNNKLREAEISKGVDWLLNNIDPSLYRYLFSLKTITFKIFMKKIFPAVVNSRNIKVAKDIIDQKIDMTSHSNPKIRTSLFHFSPEECMSIAVGNGDNRMVELLCKAGFATRIKQYYYHRMKGSWQTTLPWHTGKLQVLQTLLSFEADPEYLCDGKERGFALVDAAHSGSLEAVEMLWRAGCRVNLYVPSFGTPLQAAVCGERFKIAEFLLKHGADPNGTQYHIPFHDAKSACYMNECERFALNTSIEIACKKNNIPLAEILLEYRALVDISPLSQVVSDDYETVRALLHDRSFSYSNSVDYSLEL